VESTKPNLYDHGTSKLQNKTDGRTDQHFGQTDRRSTHSQMDDLVL